MDKHTPAPWRIKTEGNMGSLIEAQSGKRVHEFDDGYRTVASYQECCASDLYVEQEANRRANGEFIVKAVNNHDALVNALRNARNYIDAVVVNTPDKKKRRNYAECLRIIEAALKPVGGNAFTGDVGEAREP